MPRAEPVWCPVPCAEPWCAVPCAEPDRDPRDGDRDFADGGFADPDFRDGDRDFRDGGRDFADHGPEESDEGPAPEDGELELNRGALRAQLTSWALEEICASVESGSALDYSTLAEEAALMLDNALANLRDGGAIEYDPDFDTYVGFVLPNGQWVYADEEEGSSDSEGESEP